MRGKEVMGNTDKLTWDGQFDYAYKIKTLLRRHSVQYLDNAIINIILTTKCGTQKVSLLIDTKDGSIINIKTS